MNDKKTTQDDSIISNVIRADIRGMSAYHVPDASDMLKLDAMESPFQWPGEMAAEWQSRINSAAVNRYPDPQGKAVKQRLRAAVGLKDSYDIMLGNGSDEIIQIIIQAVASDEAVVISPEPSFVMFRILAEINRVRYVGVDLREDFSLDLSLMLEAIEAHQPAVIFLAQPNNPTGNLYSLADVEAIIEATPGLVVLDEAYTAFTDSDHLGLLARYDNIVVMRTASKVGLAGLRLGMLYGRSEWIEEFDKIRLPYNINTLTQISADFAIEHYDKLLSMAQVIRQQRELLSQGLSTLSGVVVSPSEANFIVIRLLDKNARDVFEGLKGKNVLVKCLDGGHPLLKNCLRITVSTEEENKVLLEKLSELV